MKELLLFRKLSCKFTLFLFDLSFMLTPLLRQLLVVRQHNFTQLLLNLCLHFSYSL